MKFNVTYISGNDLKLHTRTIPASDKDSAVTKVFELEGENFENRLVSVTECASDEDPMTTECADCYAFCAEGKIGLPCRGYYAKNLDEAIKYYEKKAEECERDSHFDTDYVCYQMSEAERKELRECASEHRQLAEWLRELRELRVNRIGRFSVGCATCIHMKTDDYTKRPCDICCYNYFSKYESEVNADDKS